jgi:hypothetical protein
VGNVGAIVIVRAVAVWLALVCVAIGNGAFREAVLNPRVGAPAGHVVSTVMLCFGVVLVSWATIPWIHPTTAGEAAGVGAVWVVLVLMFEFGFGHVIARKSWPELFADYDLLGGRVWVLALVTTAVAPYLMARVRRLW